MNCEIHALPPLRCERFQAPDVCRAVLHTVLFTRALGVVRPRDTQSELFDLTYCTCGDDDVHARIEGKVERLRGWLEDSGDKKNQSETKVVLSFFDASGDVGKTKSHCWEQWRVQIEVVRFCGSQGEGDEEGQNPSTLNAHRVAHALELQDQLRGSLSQILTLAGEKKKHIPPVRNDETVSFPFEISFGFDDEKDAGSGTLGQIRRLVTSASPPNMKLV